jgi:hypothetical protein
MYEGIIISQVILVLVVGLWLGSKFKDSPAVKFFGRNDWFVGCFLILVGYMDYVAYAASPLDNANLLLIIFGLVLISFSFIDFARN